ncbi:MAG: tol-pal system YbgF family protein, partial [Methanosarcinales archaeon]
IREKTVYDFEIEAKVPEKNIISSKVSAKKAEPILPENSKIKITEQDFKNKYQTGLDLFDKYKYQAAITQFDFLMKSNVRTNLKINCIYWIGECYFGLKNYNKAIEYFNKVAKNKSTKTPYALYMLGRSHAMLGNIKKSKEYFNTILIEYPKKPIAIKARSMLNKLILKR